jgi:hypothetical protein
MYGQSGLEHTCRGLTVQTQNTNRFSTSDSFRRLSATAVAVLIVVLAGCGGGGSGDVPSPSPASSGASLGDVITCIVGAIAFGVCPDVTMSGDSSLSEACNDPFSLVVCMDPIPSAPNRDAADTTPVPVLDTEPNDDLLTPSVATLISGDPTLGLMGFETGGHLTAVSDRIDTYIFTAPQALKISVQLCRQRGELCDDRTQESSLYPMVDVQILDFNGDPLATMADSVVDGDFVSLTVEGGLPYYVSVVGGLWSWGSDDPLSPTGMDYYLRVVGAEPSADPAPAEPGIAQPEAPQLTLTQGGAMIATLDWIAPSQNIDGTALIDLQSYVLYYGDAAGGPYLFQQPLDLGLSSYTLPLPDYGEWYFAITAVNSSGIESDLSNEVAHFDAPPEMP